MKRPTLVAAVLSIACIVGANTFATAAPVPKTIIEDPLGDANFVNDQGTGDGSNGDVTAADAGTVSDLTEVTLSNDAKNLYLMILTEAAPPATTGIGYRVRFNPDDAGDHCILVEAFFPGANNVLTGPKAHLIDSCAGGDPLPLEILGTQISIPRKSNAAFGKGAVLKSPQAQSFLYSGDYPTGMAGPTADTTKVGTDYKIVDKKK